LKIGAAKESDKNNNASGNTNVNTNGSAVNNGVGKDMNVNKNTTAAVGTDLANKGSDEFNAISKNIGVYFRCCGNILAGKLTVAQAMYKDYMAIIRAHVRDYVGEGK
jgi:hypothetical protein